MLSPLVAVLLILVPSNVFAAVGSWTTASAPPLQDVAAVELDPTDSRIVYVVAKSGTLLRSVSGGAAWLEFSFEATTLIALSTVPGRPGWLYVAGRNLKNCSQGSVFRSTDHGATWESRGSFFLGCYSSTALAADPRQHDVVYVSGYWGISRTTDGGLNWELLASSPRGVQSLAVDPFDSDLLYAGTSDSSVRRSTDEGVTWDATVAGLPRHAGVESLATDPIYAGVVYAGTGGGGIYKSTDRGAHWASLAAAVANAHVPSIVLHGVIPKVGWVLSQGTGSAGWYRTSNGGVNWTRIELAWPWMDPGASTPAGLAGGTGDPSIINTSLKEAASPAAGPSGSSGGILSARGAASRGGNHERAQFYTLHARNNATSSGFRRGVPPQLTDTPVWTQLEGVSLGPRSGGYGAPVVDPFHYKRVYFGPTQLDDLTWYPLERQHSGEYFRSNDGGKSWDLWASGYWWGLAFGAKEGLLYRLEGQNLARSTDGGQSWQPTGLDRVAYVVPDPVDPQVVWALRYLGLIDRSTDGGTTWTTVRQQYGDSSSRMAIDPKSTRTVYVGVTRWDRSMTLRTTNAGGVWEVIGNRCPEDILVDPERPSHVYLADPHYGVLKSIDNGWTWKPANKGLPRPEAWRLAYDAAEGTLYCGVSASSKGAVFKSTDAAATWQPTDSSLDDTITSLVVVAPRCLLAGAYSGVYWTEDAGATWTRSEAGLPRPAVSGVWATPADPNLIYIRSGESIFRSDDAGRHWTPINPELDPSETISLLAPAPTDGSLLFASTDSTVYVSRDRGDSWAEPLASFYASGFMGGISHIAVAPDDDNTLYVTVTAQLAFPPPVFYAAMYRTNDAGQTWVSLPIQNSVPTGQPIIGREGRLYITQSERLWRSTDRGESWTQPALPPTYLWRIAGAPSDPAVLYGLIEHGLWQSRDSGDTWNQVADLPAEDVSSLLVDPLDWDLVYVSAGQLFMLKASQSSIRRLTTEPLPALEMAVLPWGRSRVLLAAPGSPYQGLYATEILPVRRRPSPSPRPPRRDH